MQKPGKIAISLFALFSLVFYSFTANVVRAHVTGKSFEQVVDNYKVDVGYDVDTFAPNQPVRFDFDIFDTKTGSEVTFTDAWVRLVKDGQTVFATGIYRPELGRTAMVYVFPETGSYEMHVRFENPDKTIVETTILLKVDASNLGGKFTNISVQRELALALGGIVIGLILAYGVNKLKKRV